MKTILINLFILLAIIAMYYSGFWKLFSFDNALLYALALVAVVLLIGLRVLGNPFGKRK